MHRESFFSSNWLISKAAYLYYIQNLHQNEIAEQLGVSNVTVSRLISKAKDLGIISMQISEEYMNCIEYSSRIKKKYDLSEVIVANVDARTENPLSLLEIEKNTVALEGARYLQRIIKETDILGIAWGKTVHHLLNYLNPCQRTKAQFVTLHGSISQIDPDLDVLSMTSAAAMSLGGEQHRLLISGLLDTIEQKEIMMSSPQIRDIFDLFDRITVSVSGIGALYPKITTPLLKLNYMNESDIQKVIKAEAYGDIMLRFFDKCGNECNTEIKDRTMSISLNQYKKIPNKILAVSGSHKAYALDAALKGGFANTLIVDQRLAEALLTMP